MSTLSKNIFLLLTLSFAISSTHAAKPEGVGKPESPGGGKPAPAGKVEICHSGSTIDPADFVETDITFVIKTSANALSSHIAHGDCGGLFEQGDPIQECELQDDGITVVCEEKISCSCIEEV